MALLGKRACGKRREGLSFFVNRDPLIKDSPGWDFWDERWSVIGG